MKCNIVTYTDTESSFRLFGIDSYVNEALNAFLADKEYGADLQQVCVGALCLAPGRAASYPVKRPRFLRGKRTSKGLISPYTGENILTYDIELPYEEVCQASPNQVLRLLLAELISSFQLIARGQKKYPNFRTQQFIDELSFFLLHDVVTDFQPDALV
ncbi:hypothetical protein [Hymenobacter koreensis]|uniref:Uncharacterized protein n=1 Tax=Hymenobacter koreensis TaxID=1084523 RepID=A0ABP8IVN1_9BACT